MRFPLAIGESISRGGVINVLLMRASVEVRRMPARWAIAMVANLHSGWDRTVNVHPDGSVNSHQTAIFVDASIATLIETAMEYPAIDYRINLGVLNEAVIEGN